LILKFLVVGRQIYFSASKIGLDQDESLKLIDLEMPIDEFWKSEKILKEADYLIASSESGADVRELYRRFFKLMAPWAVEEKDKTWLYDRAKSRPS